MSSQVEIAARLNGVFPVLPTPFHEDGTPCKLAGGASPYVWRFGAGPAATVV
jgi:hypothetical protein